MLGRQPGAGRVEPGREPGGTLVGVALGWSPAAFDTHSFVAKGQRLYGSCAYDAADFGKALDLIGSGTANVEPLISERIALRDGPDAFVRLRHPEPGVGAGSTVQMNDQCFEQGSLLDQPSR